MAIRDREASKVTNTKAADSHAETADNIETTPARTVERKVTSHEIVGVGHREIMQNSFEAAT